MASYTSGSRERATTEPPKVVDILAREFTGKGSDLIPGKPFEAAHWWINHQEPAHEWRERMEPITINGDPVGWKTPYIDRLVSTARIFLRAPPAVQMFIINQVKNGYPWRGDQIGFYKSVIAETDKYKQNPEQYKAVGNALLRSAFDAKHGGSDEAE